MFQTMKEVYTNPPTFCEDMQKKKEKIEWIDWEITKLQSQKDLILDQLKKQTNAQIQDHPVATHSR